jgi:hypothetical protein
VKLHVLLSPQISEAEVYTVVVPIGKVLPLGGSLEMVGVLQPPVAVAVKSTTAPLVLAAVTVMLVGQFRTMGEYDCGLTVTVKLQ